MALEGISFLDWTHRYAFSNIIAVLFFVDGSHPYVVLLFNLFLYSWAANNVVSLALILGVERRNFLILMVLVAFHPIVSLYSIAPMREVALYALVTKFFLLLLKNARRWRLLLDFRILFIVGLACYLHLGMVLLLPILVLYASDFNFKVKNLLSVKA